MPSPVPVQYQRLEYPGYILPQTVCHMLGGKIILIKFIWDQAIGYL
jgi:hypothetical protein